MSDDPVEFDYAGNEQSVWKENHGNLLLGLTLLIGALGCGIIAFRQLRFVKPTFPTTDAFPNPPDTAAKGIILVPNPEGTSQAGFTDAQLDVPLVTISVSGASNDKGAMMLAIYDSAENFNQPEKTNLKGPAQIINGITSVRMPLQNLPEEFAVAAYHDENGDGMLNKSAFGAPTERYGFSNNARALIGKPPYHQAAIKRPKKDGEITIVIK